MGYGMVFLHELSHTALGKSFYNSSSRLIDIDGTVMGQVVPKMNVIRSELGANFGQRTQYAAQRGIGNLFYIPFGNQRITFIKTWK